jgi:hypothetical protein
MPSRALHEVLAVHTDSLMALPGVVGIGEGECGGVPCIKVFVDEMTEALERALPATLEGYPLVVEVTGEFRARE